MKKTTLLALLACSILSVPACRHRPRPDGMPTLLPMTLEFTQENAPVADALVTLVPEQDDGRWFAGGTTDSQGKYRCRTHGLYDGIAAGKYKVVVSKLKIDESTVKQSESGVSAESYHWIDPKHAQAGTTPLNLDVVKGTKAVSFELGPAVRIKNAQKGP